MDLVERATALLNQARKRGFKIATAESCTGGLVGGALTEIPGSSDVFDRGFITYSNTAKMDMLGVSETTLADHGAVSEQVASEMANGALARSGADLAVSITGVAGPGGSEAKPEGMVCFGLARRGYATITETHQFGPIGRKNVRGVSVQRALSLLERGCSESA